MGMSPKDFQNVLPLNNYTQITGEKPYQRVGAVWDLKELLSPFLLTVSKTGLGKFMQHVKQQI